MLLQSTLAAICAFQLKYFSRNCTYVSIKYVCITISKNLDFEKCRSCNKLSIFTSELFLFLARFSFQFCILKPLISSTYRYHIRLSCELNINLSVIICILFSNALLSFPVHDLYDSNIEAPEMLHFKLHLTFYTYRISNTSTLTVESLDWLLREAVGTEMHKTLFCDRFYKSTPNNSYTSQPTSSISKLSEISLFVKQHTKKQIL